MSGALAPLLGALPRCTSSVRFLDVSYPSRSFLTYFSPPCFLVLHAFGRGPVRLAEPCERLQNEAPVRSIPAGEKVAAMVPDGVQADGAGPTVVLHDDVFAGAERLRGAAFCSTRPTKQRSSLCRSPTHLPRTVTLIRWLYQARGSAPDKNA